MDAYQHILVGTDFSTLSEEVVKKTIRLAGHFNAQISILHVVLPEDIDSNQFSITDKRFQLESFIKSIPNFKAIPIVRVSTSNIEEEIIKVAGQIKANLIIIGSNDGGGSLAQPSLNADSIKGKAPCDVLVVRSEGA